MPGTLPRHKRTAHNYKLWLGTVKNPTMKRRVHILNTLADEEYNKDKAKLIAEKPKPKVIKEKVAKKKY
jgi:hypothetical protein